jgi:DNA-binding MarR family transcriptional regulator
MAGRIQTEIRQTKPIGSLEEEAFLNLQRTANELSQAMTELLKEHDLTQTQYNVLRILRGAGKAGLTAGDIGERMITRDPDVTRLLDRLERRRLVERWRCTEDRRVVWTRITAQGVDVIRPLDPTVDELHVRLLAHMGEDRLRQLIELLEAARDGMGA